MANQYKLSQVNDLLSLLKKSNNFILMSFDKIKHKDLEELRKEIKKNHASLKVLKNTLFQKAVNKLSNSEKIYKEIRKNFFPLQKQSMILFFKDEWSMGLKALREFMAKDKNIDFKFSFLDNIFYNYDNTKKISLLPTKNQSVANIIGNIKNPMSKTIYVMKYNTQKFAYIIKQMGKQSK